MSLLPPSPSTFPSTKAPFLQGSADSRVSSPWYRFLVDLWKRQETSQRYTGEMMGWPVTTHFPTGWLRCDGSAISRTTYSNLFAIIGTTYGAGDGVTTFNLPNVFFQSGWYLIKT